jgi:hypothetical protein
VINALRWLAGLVTQNFGWKLLALLIAFILWALVATEPEVATFESVRVEYRNLPEDLEIASEPVSLVTLELRGPSGELRGAGSGPRPSVVLDAAGAGAGVRTFTIGDGNVHLARGVHLVRAIPSEVRLDLERRAYRDLKVVPRLAGSPPAGYVVDHCDVWPPQLPVAGPASRVDHAGAAVTDPVDVSQVVGTSEFHVNAFVDDPYVRITAPARVVVKVAVRKQ